MDLEEPRMGFNFLDAVSLGGILFQNVGKEVRQGRVEVGGHLEHAFGDILIQIVEIGA